MAKNPESISSIQIGNNIHEIDAVSVGGKELKDLQQDGLVTEINPSSDDEHYPSAKCVKDVIYD